MSFWYRRPGGRKANPEGRMSVMDHLRELRHRLIMVIVIIALGAVVGWVFYTPILDFLKHPYCSVPTQYRYVPQGGGKCTLIYHGVLDGFTARMKISVIAGAVLTGPIWLYQIWAFVTPGLRKNERKYTLWFIAASSTLFVAGMALAYVVLAKGLNVVLRAAGSGTQALLTVNDYISFISMMLIVFGLAFELPLLIVMANLAGVLSGRLLKKSQRIGIFLIFLFAAVATPSTDPFTMCAMALPMVLLFEGAVLFAVLHDKRKARRKAEQDALADHERLDDETPSSVDAVPRPLDSWTDVT